MGRSIGASAVCSILASMNIVDCDICDVSSIDSLLQTPRASTRRRDPSEAANQDDSTAAGAWASGVGAAGGEDEGGADRAWARRRDASRAADDAADADGDGSVSRAAACT